VIGTMNTADRSIALIDIALRRRFSFEELMPESQVLVEEGCSTIEVDGETINIAKMLDAMNDRVEFLYDRDHCLGHSYLLEIDTFDQLVTAFKDKIIPLLQEYFYGDWEKIQLVFRDLKEGYAGQTELRENAIIVHRENKAADVLGINGETFQDRRTYSVSTNLTVQSFLKIYA
jgi:5-methylcytosine-specific restriction protein B